VNLRGVETGRVKSCVDKKIPKTKVFGARINTELCGSAFTFYYPDYTVGFGVTPNHACITRRLPLNGETITAQKGSWALPPIGNSLID